MSTRIELITADILTADFVWDLSNHEPCTSDVNSETCQWIIRCVHSSILHCSPKFYAHFVSHYALTAKTYVLNQCCCRWNFSFICTAAVIYPAKPIYWIVVHMRA